MGAPILQLAKTSSRTRALIIVAAFVLALIPRLAFFAVEQPWQPSVVQKSLLRSDALGYHKLAISILEDGRFLQGEGASPEVLRTPGYPLLVAAVYSILGEQPWGVLLLQGVLESLAAALLCWGVASHAGMRVGFLAAAFYALDPLMILHANLLLSDSLFAVLMVAVVVLLIRQPACSHAALRLAVIQGVVLGAAVLVRPVALYLAPLVGFSWLRLDRRPGPGALMTQVGTWLLSLALVLLPVVLAVSSWSVHNSQEAGWAGFSTSQAYNLLAINAATVTAAANGVPFQEAQQILESEALRRARLSGVSSPRRGWNDPRMTPYWQMVALETFRAHPVLTAREYVVGVVRMFANLGTQSIMVALGDHDAEAALPKGEALVSASADGLFTGSGVDRLVVAVFVGAYNILTYGCLVVGLVALTGQRASLSRWGWMMAFVAYFVLVTGIGGAGRFRLPAVPFYTPICAVGVMYLKSQFGERTFR